MLPQNADINTITQSLIKKLENSRNVESFWEDNDVKSFYEVTIKLLKKADTIVKKKVLHLRLQLVAKELDYYFDRLE